MRFTCTDIFSAHRFTDMLYKFWQIIILNDFTENLFYATFIIDIIVTSLQYKHYDLSIIWPVVSRKLYKYAVWPEHGNELKYIANDWLYNCSLM